MTAAHRPRHSSAADEPLPIPLIEPVPGASATGDLLDHARDTDSVATLEASHLEVHYGAVEALRRVSVVIRGGDLVAVTGPSGAGKTSLLSALSGVIAPTGGGVWVDGAPVRDRDDAVRRGIVLIPQGNALVRIFTAAENVAVPIVGAGRAGDRSGDVRRQAIDALQLVGLDEAADQLVEELSGGQQQRAAVARGLAQLGRFVLADEPTSELDATNRERIMGLLRAEAHRGAGVLVATHDPEAAAGCNAELRLDEGVATWIRDER